MTVPHRPTDQETEFERRAASGSQGLLQEFVAYLRATRKWWLAPILVMLALLAVLIVLGGTGAAPFIYTLF